jgi:hypothetical protein
MIRPGFLNPESCKDLRAGGIGKAGVFSSDLGIKSYNGNIWRAGISENGNRHFGQRWPSRPTAAIAILKRRHKVAVLAKVASALTIVCSPTGAPLRRVGRESASGMTPEAETPP